ncbi:cholinephosphotransferase 1 isoform X4 [Bombyx mandarina]|uniref:diacylglycerol cholinephosphotransferase n=2 Tax=Bombyx TaxID=7090 RepID=A0A8R2DL86_BOMMO|nr:cholinephosphotransferase 1 isoform X1 [Bombyx mori]XP_028030955.1 cholinephosphotransferase 1 isoform X4 [Bombyx mandarina]
MQFYKERILNAAQLKRLSEHKYSCTSASVLDAWLQPWWCWLVSKTPLWLAPNLITILGLIVNIVTTLILVWYSPDARQDPPRWACALCALGVFVYQSLDAIDGKQARRTGSQSPLGELFDHGCDSISTVFIALGACIAVKLGEYPTWMFFQCFCAMTLFYCAHWQAYVTGTLKMGRIDVTEAQFSIIGIHLISAVLGPDFWSTQVGGGLEIRYSVALAAIVGAFLTIGTLAAAIVSGGVGKNGSTVALPTIKISVNLISNYVVVLFTLYLVAAYINVIVKGGVGKNGSTVAGTSILSPVIPFSLVVVPAFIIFQKSESHVYENHPALYILAFGMVTAKVTNKLVVAHMTKSEMEYYDWSLLGPAMLFLNQYFNNALPEYWVLWLCTVWVCGELVRYCGQVCREICDHLDIQLFRIPRAAPAPASASAPAHSKAAPDRNAPCEPDRSDAEDTEPLLNNNSIS